MEVISVCLFMYLPSNGGKEKSKRTIRNCV